MRVSGRDLALIMILASLPANSFASGAGATALTFNTSARAEGMGGAGVASVWDGDTNLWANPALLAFRPGVRFGTMHSRLAEGLADDIFIDKQELTLGYAGIGLLYAEAPFDNVHLDLGAQQGTDENGNPTGTFESWEKSHAFGLGVGVTQALDRFLGTRLNRWFDVGLGYVWRNYEEQLAVVSREPVPDKVNRLGLVVRELTDDQREQLGVDQGGVRVESATDGPAAAAGITSGDVILMLDNQPVDSLEGFNRILEAIEPGRSVAALIQRGDGRMFYALRLPKG